MAGNSVEINSSYPEELRGGGILLIDAQARLLRPPTALYLYLSQSLYNLDYSHSYTCLTNLLTPSSYPQCLQQTLSHPSNLINVLWMSGNIFLMKLRSISSILKEYSSMSY